jgi:hypothetical protein
MSSDAKIQNGEILTDSSIQRKTGMNPPTIPIPHRQIHLDFHTPAGVAVGDQFDATTFFDTLESAKVNSIALFAKCHHGYSYFNTKVGTHHPC